jgi:hypothetical protein
VIRVCQIKAHDRTVDARRVYDGRDERPLVSEGCDDAWKQLCEERRPMLSKACGLQAGHGKQFTGMMKSDGTSIWVRFVKPIKLLKLLKPAKPRSVPSSDNNSEPFEADEEDDSVAGLDSRSRSLVVVAVSPKRKQTAPRF